MALSPQKGPCTLRLRFPLEKAQIGSVWRQRAFLCLPGHDGETQNHHADVDKGNVIPGANVIPSSQPERVPHRWTKLRQLAVLLAPKVALSETTVSFALREK